MEVPNIVHKAGRSQALQSELEEFLAKGGKIKVIDKPIQRGLGDKNTFVESVNTGKYFNYKYNSILRSFVSNEENLNYLINKMAITKREILAYTKGFKVLTESFYYRHFSEWIDK